MLHRMPDTPRRRASHGGQRSRSAITPCARAFATPIFLIPTLLLGAREVAAACNEADFATCTTMAFTATADSVADPLGLFGTVGTTFTGWVTIETDIDDQIGGPDFGFYPGAVECAEVDFGQETFGVELDLASPGETPGIEVQNNIPSAAGGFTLLADGLEGSIVGLTTAGNFVGGGGIAYGYGEGCIQGFPGCPPSLLTDDSIPGPPGNLTTGARGGQIVVRFEGLLGGAAIVSGDLLELTSSPDRPCPEPGMASALSIGLVAMTWRARRKRLPVRRAPPDTPSLRPQRGTTR